ncbi:hypothetical protein WN51_10854 [Melipona quadrifasciata]|uniref:Uncharacterized protein n=1 Tax=Melipona quadrifasciata TaxID=166423 RepID=A0A0N0BI99_9HYME|nr:hypothetical protein WN51_10854 [Melipona quadrifasciata]
MRSLRRLPAIGGPEEKLIGLQIVEWHTRRTRKIHFEESRSTFIDKRFSRRVGDLLKHYFSSCITNFHSLTFFGEKHLTEKVDEDFA